MKRYVLNVCGAIQCYHVERNGKFVSTIAVLEHNAGNGISLPAAGD